MIDEQVLERALRAEAAAYEVPPDGPAGILAAAGDPEPGESSSRWPVALLSAAAALVVGALLVTAGGRALRTADTGVPSGAGSGYWVMSDGAPNQTSERAADPAAKAPRDALGLAGGGAENDPKVVRTGDLALEVPRDRVPATVRALGELAAAHRGFVSSSSTITSRETPYGRITLRVPAASLDRVTAEAARLGTVVSSEVRGEDVTAEVEDVAARLRSLAAARRQLEALLSRAANVGEVLTVQQQITEVQTEIEKLQARQKQLTDQTTFATLTVGVTGPGGHEPERDGFGQAWQDAVDGFVGGLRGLVAASGTILFALLAGGVLLLVGRALYRLYVRRLV